MTLQELCLNKIVELFDRFNFAFNTANDVNVKRRFEFLQRKYSFQILQKLSEDNCISDEHADFLFNRHLKVLDTEWFSSCSWEIVKRKFAEIGPSLQKLCINQLKDEIRWVKFLCHLPNIKVIQFGIFCDDTFLRGIVQYCHNIETIDIKYSSKVTDRGLKFLCLKRKDKFQCPLLKELYVNGTTIERSGMKYLLQHIPSLEKTDYSNLGEVLYEMHKYSINALDKVKPYNLTKLNLMYVVPTQHHYDILKISLSVCPHLKVLHCLVVDQEELKLCYNLTELEELCLNCSDGASVEINEFLKFRGNKLVSLKMWNVSLTASDLVLNCPRLSKLYMNGVNFLNDKDSIHMLYNLEELSLENCIFSDTQTSKSLGLLLSSSLKFKQLCFKNCELLTAEIRAAILTCCTESRVKQIGFENSTVQQELLMDILLMCSSLKYMNVKGCSVKNDFKRNLLRISDTLPNRPSLSTYSSDHGSFYSGIDSDVSEDSDDDYSYFMDYYVNPHYFYHSSDSDDLDNDYNF